MYLSNQLICKENQHGYISSVTVKEKVKRDMNVYRKYILKEDATNSESKL